MIMALNQFYYLLTNTYIIIPASNETTRPAELTNVQQWAERNNLKQVDRGHLQRPQAKATPCCSRCRTGTVAWNSAQQLSEDAGR